MNKSTFNQDLLNTSKMIVQNYTFKNNIDPLIYTIAEQLIFQLYIQLESSYFDQINNIKKWLPKIQRSSIQVKIKKKELIKQKKVNQNYLKKVKQLISIKMDPNQYYIMLNTVYSVKNSEPQFINQQQKNLEKIRTIIKYISYILYQYSELFGNCSNQSIQFTIFQDLYLMEGIYTVKSTHQINISKNQQKIRDRIEKLKKLSAPKLNLFYKYISMQRSIDFNKINFINFFQSQASLSNFYQDSKIQLKVKKILKSQMQQQRSQIFFLDQISKKMLINLFGKPSQKFIYAIQPINN